ncbi:MAG: cysteine synthase family protein [Clostridia bacterium]|nr:cysteine synthase family protein [Clostridia bacterium]
MIHNTILDAVGNTPVIRLNKIVPKGAAEILVKFEGLNVGGSIKTRTALNMIKKAMADGLVKQDTVIVEPTSGNQGIGLALAGAVLGLEVIIILPDSVSEERTKIITAYGAKVIKIHDNGNIGECIEECLDTAMELAAKNPKVYIPQQFVNPANPEVHLEHTAKEIIEQVGGPIHGFCSGVGTGGTLSGIGGALKAVYPDIEIWAVEPENAAILSGGSIGTHLQMGIGDGIVPDNLNTDIYSHIHIVKDREAIDTAQQLARKEGILCGISSGTNVSAAIEMAKKLGEGKRVITVLPDTGERYFSTELFEN